jgi:acyl carrier protein
MHPGKCNAHHQEYAAVSEFKQALCRALVTQFGVNRSRLDDDAGLFSTGLIDSLSVMDLVCFVEQAVGCTISPTEITLDNFDSVNRIVSLVEMLTAVGGGR